MIDTIRVDSSDPKQTAMHQAIMQKYMAKWMEEAEVATKPLMEAPKPKGRELGLKPGTCSCKKPLCIHKLKDIK